MVEVNCPDGFTAIVLAGDRTADDPFVLASGRSSKALIEIDGMPMVLRVLDALGEAAGVARTVLSGPGAEALEEEPRLQARIDQQTVQWRAPLGSPSTSAASVLAGVDLDAPVLLTTADHPLLRAEIVDYFCQASLDSGADVTVGLAPYALVRESFPTMKKTVLRFRDGEYCGCNLFAFLTPRGRGAAERWREVESERKSPLKVIRILGWSAVLGYRFGLLSLDGALARLSRRLGMNVVAIRLPFGDAAVDVDSSADHAQVQQRLAEIRRHGDGTKSSA